MSGLSDWVNALKNTASMPLLSDSQRKSMTKETSVEDNKVKEFRRQEAQYSGRHIDEFRRLPADSAIEFSRIVDEEVSAGSAIEFSRIVDEEVPAKQRNYNLVQGLNFEQRGGKSKLSKVPTNYANYLKANSSSPSDYMTAAQQNLATLQAQYNTALAKAGPLKFASKKDIQNLASTRRHIRQTERTLGYFNLMKSTGNLNFQVFGTGKNVNLNMIKTYLEAFKEADKSSSASDLDFKAGAVHTRNSGRYAGEQYDISSRLRRGKITNGKDTNFIKSEGGEGHIQKVVYNIPYSIMEVTFAKGGYRGNVCVFFEVPVSVAYQICNAIETNATVPFYQKEWVRGKKLWVKTDRDEVHLAGVLFWDYIRVRTTVSGVRYPFEYMPSATDIESATSLQERSTPDSHGIMNSDPVTKTKSRSVKIQISIGTTLKEIKIPIESGCMEDDNFTGSELYDSGILGQILDWYEDEDRDENDFTLIKSPSTFISKKEEVTNLIKDITNSYENKRDGVVDVRNFGANIARLIEYGVNPEVFEEVVIDDLYEL